MAGLCEHETFKSICNLCHRDNVITTLRAENEKLRAGLRQIAGIDVWDNSEQGYVDKARAACQAMLKAWPGSYSLTENDSAEIRDVAAIILPLPKENTND